MSNKNDVAEEAAEKINNKSNLQIMSHSVMALKQNIEDKLKKDGDVNSIFEEKIKSLYGKDAIESDKPSYKAYVRLEWTDDLIEQDKDDSKNYAFARIYSKIDRVLSVEDGSVSYALHLGITSHGKGTSSYDDEGFISEDCGRFAVGHDIGHTILNLNDLIRNTTTNDNQSIIKEKKDDDTAKHYEADFFSYMLSDFRDFYLLELDGKFDLGKASESYKKKAISKFLGSVIKETVSEAFINKEQDKKQFFNRIKDKIEERLNEIKEVFEKSKKLYDDSLQYTMSHPIIALNEIINSKFQSEVDDKLEELRNELKKREFEKKSISLTGDFSEIEIEKIFSKYKIDGEMEDLNRKIEDLENKKPGINVHLISKEGNNKELYIDCYNRRDENSKKDSYCFEIAIKKFSSKEEKNNRSKEICKAIGFIYFGYKLIIKRFENDNKLGHLIISNMQQYINDFELSEEKINDFADKLCNSRRDNFENKRNDIKKETNLKNRLVSYTI
jgi:hypothetical protein